MNPATDPLDAVHLGPEAVRRYLRRNGLEPRTSLSQNHLVDRTALEARLEAAQPAPGRHGLEVGSGIGILPGALLGARAAVTAVEVDARLARHLRTRFAAEMAVAGEEPGVPGSLALVEGDVLDLSIEGIVEPPYDLVANLPYHITSPVLHLVLGGEPRPERFVLMLQREVAERIAAEPGGMSYLSVFVQYHAAVRVLRVVPAAAFEPVPEVDSAILAGTARPPRLSSEEESSLWRLVQAGFRERRKMLRNVLGRQLPELGGDLLARAFARAEIAPDRRPQTLSVADWLALAEALGTIGPGWRSTSRSAVASPPR